MRTKWMGFLILLAAVVMIAGCGGPEAQSVKPTEVTPRDAVRQTLEGIAESGQGGSQIGTLLSDIDKLAAEDSALAADLKADAEPMMMGAMSSDAIKAKAQEMLGKLGGGGESAPEE